MEFLIFDSFWNWFQTWHHGQRCAFCGLFAPINNLKLRCTTTRWSDATCHSTHFFKSSSSPNLNYLFLPTRRVLCAKSRFFPPAHVGVALQYLSLVLMVDHRGIFGENIWSACLWSSSGRHHVEYAAYKGGLARRTFFIVVGECRQVL